jgi:hypothetical protein
MISNPKKVTCGNFKSLKLKMTHYLSHKKKKAFACAVLSVAVIQK